MEFDAETEPEMMIDELAAARAKRSKDATPDDPHLTGKARCKACGYEFVLVMPTGRCSAPCPKCDCDAHLLGEVITDGDQWRCSCGFQLFRIDRNGPYCCRCGVQAVWEA